MNVDEGLKQIANYFNRFNKIINLEEKKSFLNQTETPANNISKGYRKILIYANQIKLH